MNILQITFNRKVTYQEKIKYTVIKRTKKIYSTSTNRTKGKKCIKTR